MVDTTAHLAAASSPPSAGRVLVTGFEPFDGEPVNPSWEAVRALDGWHFLAGGGSAGPVALAGSGRGSPQAEADPQGGVIVRARQIPCVFGGALQVLSQAIDEWQPSLVIGVGQAGGRAELSVERVAINVDDGRIADNAGRQPIDQPVAAGGPAAYFSTLPIKAMVQALRQAGIPASVSNTAGTFVCNHLFYGLMHQLATATRPAIGAPHSPAARGGFIHIPYLPEQAARHTGQPSMALASLIEGLRIAITTAWSVRQDILETGGRLH